MAENDPNLERNIERAEELKTSFGSINNAVNELNRALRQTGENTAEVSRVFAQLKTSADNVSKVQRSIQESTAGTAKAINEQKDNQDRATKLAKQANEFYTQAQTATGKTRENLLRQSENLLRASGEAKTLAELYKEIALQAANLDNSTKFFRVASNFISSIPGFKAFAEPFQQAEKAAREAVSKTGSTLAGFGSGLKSLGKGLFDMLSLPALIAGTLQLSKNTKELSNNLGISMSSAREMLRDFDRFALKTEDSRITTQKLAEAQNKISNQLGLAVQFSGETLQNFIMLTEYMGVSTEAASKLTMLSEGLGVNSRDFTNNIAESVSVSAQALGVNIPLKEAYETIGKMSNTTLINLQRNPEAIARAVVEAKALGASFEQLSTTANSLLDFESSIQNELQAELLVGRQLNLERARSAALTGDQASLARELKSQIGSINDFEKMNVIQREALAQAFGLNVEQLSEMLLKQEALTANSKAARDLTTEQISQARALAREKNIGFGEALSQIQEERDAAKAFEDASKKLLGTFQRLFIDLAPILEKIANIAGGLAANPFFKGLVGLGAGAAALTSIMKTLNLMPQKVFVVNQTGGGAGGAGGGMLSTYGAGSYSGALSAARAKGLSNKQIAAGFGGKGAMKGLANRGMVMKGAGIAAIGGLAGAAMMQSENEGMQIGGAALSGASTGAMVGGMLGPMGMLAGAGIGAAIGGLTAYLNKKDKEEEKAKDTGAEKYDKMIKLLEEQAKKDTKIFMDANQVGISMALGNPRLN